MLATHDPRLIAIGEDRARWFDRSPDEFEFQMLYGVRPEEQRRLAGEGYTVRVYLPYGNEWYGYLMRRLAERPANLVFFARALTSVTADPSARTADPAIGRTAVLSPRMVEETSGDGPAVAPLDGTRACSPR